MRPGAWAGAWVCDVRAPGTRRPWTDEELTRLYEQAPHHSVPALAEMFGRAPASVRVKLDEMGWRARPCYTHWTVRDTRILRERWPDPRIPTAAIAAELGRTVKAIRAYAKLLGIQRDFAARKRCIVAHIEAGQSRTEAALREGVDVRCVDKVLQDLRPDWLTKRRRWTAEEDAALRAACIDGRPADTHALAAQLGRTHIAVLHRLRVHGFPSCRRLPPLTATAVQRLTEHLAAGLSVAEAARRLGVSDSQARAAIDRHRLPVLVPTRKHYARWTDADDYSLRARVADGWGDAEIAADLARTEHAVRHRRLYLSLPEAA